MFNTKLKTLLDEGDKEIKALKNSKEELKQELKVKEKLFMEALKERKDYSLLTLSSTPPTNLLDYPRVPIYKLAGASNKE